MSWTLAHNLAVRARAIQSCYPGIIIGEVGNTAHQAEQSDHNPDARDIVHAIDVMTYSNETRAKAVVAWALAHPADLQYVIHDQQIWDVKTGWKPRPYTGSDPHTNHVHISGRHGSTGRNAATGTGYDTAAEAMTPAGTPCNPQGDDMPLTDSDIQKIVKAVWHTDGTLTGVKTLPVGPRDPKNANGWAAASGIEQAVNTSWAIQQLLNGGLADKIAAAIAPKVTGLTEAQIKTAVAAELATLTLAAVPTAAGGAPAAK